MDIFRAFDANIFVKSKPYMKALNHVNMGPRWNKFMKRVEHLVSLSVLPFSATILQKKLRYINGVTFFGNCLRSKRKGHLILK